MSKEWPQQNELRAMPLDERLIHASRAALVEDKEAIDMARDRIAELEAALRRAVMFIRDEGNSTAHAEADALEVVCAPIRVAVAP